MDNSLLNQWTIPNPKCQKCLDAYPIFDETDVTFLHVKILARLNVVAKVAEQKKSDEQKYFTHNNGNNWYGNDPILCLIHALDKMKIRHLYMSRHDLSNNCVVLNNN